MAGACEPDPFEDFLHGYLGPSEPEPEPAPAPERHAGEGALEAPGDGPRPLEMTEARPRLPGIARQKAFIVESAAILDKGTKLAILSLVMLEVGVAAVVELHTPHASREEVDINLDVVAAASEDVLGHIYNIVRARREALSRPATAGNPG